MRPLKEIKLDLNQAICDRERESRDLFVAARQGQQIDGQKFNRLNAEAQVLKKALDALCGALK